MEIIIDGTEIIIVVYCWICNINQCNFIIKTLEKRVKEMTV